MNPFSLPEGLTALPAIKILKLGDYCLQCSLLLSVQVPSFISVLLRNGWKQLESCLACHLIYRPRGHVFDFFWYI